MNHSVKRRRQALHQTHHHYYLNISVQAANLSNWRIESNRKNRFGSENRIESKRNFFVRIGMLYLMVRGAGSICKGTVSVRLSLRLSVPASMKQPSAEGLLLWARQAGDIDRLLSGAQQQCRAAGECGQCHVVSVRSKLRTHSF